MMRRTNTCCTNYVYLHEKYRSIEHEIVNNRIIDICEGCDIRVFPKIDHSGSSVRIVLEQNKFSKKLPLTGIEPSTVGL